MAYALITGGAIRIGQALALHLAARGYDILLHHHQSTAAAQQTAAKISALGVRCILIQADLTAQAGVARLLESLPALPAVMILNASLFERDTALDASFESWQRHQMIHGYANLALMQRMAGAASGDVITLLDHTSHRAPVDFCSYALSKAQLRQLTLVMAKALAPRVRVNGLALSYVMPARTQRQSHFDAHVAATPSGVPVPVEDILKSVDYLLATPSVSGQILTLDGAASL